MPLPEKTFENEIKKFLSSHGIWYLKVWGGGMQRAGIPDLLMCIRGRFVAIEVKAENGKPSALQLREIEGIKKSGGQAKVLYPKDFEDFKRIVFKMLNDINDEVWL